MIEEDNRHSGVWPESPIDEFVPPTLTLVVGASLHTMLAPVCDCLGVLILLSISIAAELVGSVPH
jgi:hypothetical protein